MEDAVMPRYSRPDKHLKLLVVVTLLVCIIGVTLISRSVLMHQSLRLDEAQSMWQSSHSAGDTLRIVAQDVHVPLYHLVLHYWQLYFGHDVTTVRLLSLLFFLFTIPLFYKLSRAILSVRWSLFATIIFSFLPFMDWYANEARMYTLLALFATLSQIYFVRIIERKKGWFGYGITGVVGAYVHYFFSFNLATQAIFFLINRSRFARGSFKRFIAVGMLVGAALLPWLIYFYSLGAGKNTSPILVRPSTVDFFNAFSQFVFGFQNNYINTIILSAWPLLVIVAFLAIKRGQRISLALSYIISAAFIPVLLAFALSFILTPFFLSRYMVSSVGPIVILIVWLISHYGRRLAAAASTLLILVLLASGVQQIKSTATPVKEDYKAVAAAIAKQAQPQDIVVISAPFTIYPLEYYYNGPVKIATLPMWDRQATGAIPAFNKNVLPKQVDQLNQNHRMVYLILSQNQGYENEIKQYYMNHFKEISHHSYSPGLSLYVYQVGYNNVPSLTTVGVSSNATK